MKKILLFLWALPLFAGISFAQTPSLEQFTILSQQIVDQAEDKNARLDMLKELFTSCQTSSTKKEIKELCKNFLEKNLPELDANNRIYEAEDLLIPFSGTKISLTELWVLSAAEVQQYVGIADVLSGKVLSGYGGQKAQVSFSKPEFFLINLEDEGISFFTRGENTLSLEEVAKIRASLPDNGEIQDPKYQEKIHITQGSGVEIKTFSRRGYDGQRKIGERSFWYLLSSNQPNPLNISKYQLPENFPLEKFKENLVWRVGVKKNKRIIEDFSTFIQYPDKKSLKKDAPLYNWSIFQDYGRTVPFGRNLNQGIEKGDIVVFTNQLKDILYIINKTTNLIYEIEVPHDDYAARGIYAIDINNPDGRSSFQLKK